ncbi:MAG: FtsW/RodA/SpoVE family cell cycle protein [Ruminococcus sp.]|nr:FtsW/RodA/SpoVE family cell cycle protein [Ruminococcus sp.]
MAAEIAKTKTAAGQAGRKRKTFNFRFVLAEIDKTFFAIIVILLVFGLIMMFSASYATALNQEGDGYYYLKRQLFCAGLGIAGMFVASFLDYNFFFNTKVAYLFFTGSLGLCFYTAFFGEETADARRWITIFGIQFQPSEMLKIAFIFIFAFILSVNFQKFDKNWKYCMVPFFMIFAAVFLVLLLQRHMSAVMLFGVIGISIMFASGMRKKYFWIFIGICVGIGLLGGLVLILKGGGNFSYITDRIQSWRDPMSDPSDKTHQTYESMLAIGSGGWFGLGFGESRQKYMYLPESQNDFIFAVICEELGFFGGFIVVLLFVLFILKGFQIAANSRDRFGTLVATGITVQIGIQALLNILVATNGFPNTGISLPFFSAGGTALVFQLCEMGVMLSISRQNIKRGAAKTKEDAAENTAVKKAAES